jgi:hypothetical protein
VQSFDNLEWGWLREFIQRRINDGGILRLNGKWLNAGIMEGEDISYSDKETPQGGVVAMPWVKFQVLLERICRCLVPKSSTQSDRLRDSKVMCQEGCCDPDYRGTG